jgi:uncharacterized membrane protein YhaH (DUF805 family)
MDADEVAAYRRRHARVRRTIWWSLTLAILVVGYGIGLVATLLVGAVVTVALIAAAQPVFLRWDRASQLNRFPSLPTIPT